MYERIGSSLTSNVLPAIAEDRQKGDLLDRGGDYDR